MKLKSIWLSLPDEVKRAIHTFYQTFVATFLVGIEGVFNTHSLPAAKTALVALCAASLAASFSALKSLYVSSRR